MFLFHISSIVSMFALLAVTICITYVFAVARPDRLGLVMCIGVGAVVIEVAMLVTAFKALIQ